MTSGTDLRRIGGDAPGPSGVPVPSRPDRLPGPGAAAGEAGGRGGASGGGHHGRGEPGDGLPRPHGGRLRPLAVADPAVAAAEEARAAELRRVAVTGRALDDLELLACGALSPLSGFMRGDEYRSVVADMRLPDGLLWPLPVTLPVPDEAARGLRDGDEVALYGPDGSVAVLTVEDRFVRDLPWEARHAFGTDDPAHPGVAAVLAEPPVCLGGPVRVLRRRPRRPYELDPAETRAAFAARGWRVVAAFQSRNPAHRAHEYLQKCALEICDGLLLHPLVGHTKADDVPTDVRLRCYEVLIRHYYPADRVVLAGFPAAMRYAGPREAVFHAICRKNYGCSHFVVGRDHAGVGQYYGPFDAQHLMRRLAGELGVTPLCFENAFFCRRCGGMATAKTCPHGPEHHVTLSGTAVRAMLRRGELPPPEFTRPEVAAVLAAAVARP
jgi:sulfate adenylyltransferase